MTLKEYLKKENITQTEFIYRIEKATGDVMPQGTLAKYILGSRIPRKKDNYETACIGVPPPPI